MRENFIRLMAGEIRGEEGFLLLYIIMRNRRYRVRKEGKTIKEG